MIADLEKAVERFVNEYVEGRREALAEALALAAGPRIFPALLGEIARDEGRFREVADRAVWHPNGFAQIVLLMAAQYRLRLHVWGRNPASSVIKRENIHNHRWDFAAVILCGGYRHEEFRPAVSGESFFGYRYQRLEGGTSFTLEPKERQTLVPVFDGYLPQGSRYTLSSTVLHRVVPVVAEATVSLVLEGPHKTTEVEVFSRSEISQGATTPFDRLSDAALRDQMSAVAALPVFV